MSTYPCRPKAEASSDTVDVVERTAPQRSAHVQLDDVPRALDPVELHGRVLSARQRGDGYDEVTGAGLRLSTATV